jgi:hypothetical protein
VAIITGDVVSGYAWNGKSENFFATQYEKFTIPFYENNLYWALTAGNHDSQGDLTRDQISDLDRSYNLSLTQPNAENTSHAFNY